MGRPRKGTSSPDSPPPLTEVRCMKLQEQYLQPDCPQEVKDEFFSLLRIYARSLTLKEIKRKRIFLPPERVDEICTDATMLLMNGYEKPEWKVSKSFGGALYYKIIEAMYTDAKDEQMSSLNDTFSKDRDSKEVIDTVGSNNILPWLANDNKTPESDNPEDIFLRNINSSFIEIKDIIDEAYESLPYSTFMKFLPWLVLQIRKPRTRNIQRLFSKLFLTSKEENAFDILLLEIRNRILQHV